MSISPISRPTSSGARWTSLLRPQRHPPLRQSPIVFAAVGDPIGSGVVKSLVRPGGNATGLSLQATDAVGKRLQLLGEVITGLRRLAIMANSGNPSAALEMREAEDTAPHAGSRRSYIRNPSIRRHRACVRH